MERVVEDVKTVAVNAGKILMEYFESDKLNERTKSTVADILTDADLASDKYIREALGKLYPKAGVITEEGKTIEPEMDDPFYFCADPLDGTTNFSCNYPHFCVSIGVLDKNFEPLAGVIYDPNRDELFWALKGQGAYLSSPRESKRRLSVRHKSELINALVVTGFNPKHVSSEDNNMPELERILPKVRCVRRDGSAALDMAWVAAGRLDGYWENGPHIWDVAAGWIIAEEAGCVVSHYDGRRFSEATLFLPELSIVVACPELHPQLVDEICAARAK